MLQCFPQYSHYFYKGEYVQSSLFYHSRNVSAYWLTSWYLDDFAVKVYWHKVHRSSKLETKPISLSPEHSTDFFWFCFPCAMKWEAGVSNMLWKELIDFSGLPLLSPACLVRMECGRPAGGYNIATLYLFQNPVLLFQGFHPSALQSNSSTP